MFSILKISFHPKLLKIKLLVKTVIEKKYLYNAVFNFQT